MTALHVQTSTHDHATILAVIGPVTAHTARQLRDHIWRVVDDQPAGATVHMDLCCCTDLDAAGLITLDVAARAATRRGAVVQLVNVSPLLTLVVQRYHFEHLLAPQLPGADEGDAVDQPTSITDEFDDAGDLDDEDGSANGPGPMPWEADPADVAEHHRVVPLRDDDRDQQ